jgi:organic hydroperoxide reductase OsmC/OhrA
MTGEIRGRWSRTQALGSRERRIRPHRGRNRPHVEDCSAQDAEDLSILLGRCLGDGFQAESASRQDSESNKIKGGAISETAGSGVHVHRYYATCHWEGDTAVGYETYDRTHTSSAPPASAELTVSSDSTFIGDPQKLNPEQLVVMATSSCQLLSFLAIAARARVQVLEYEDHAEAHMSEEEKPMRLSRITLRPRIVVGPGVKEKRVLRYTEMAHKLCYVANSLRTDVVVEPKVEIREEESAD